MILAEPRGARALFLREVCEQLGLKGVEVYDHKIGADYPGQVGGVITRAVGSITETLDRVTSCLGPGGRMIFMKGPDCDQEIGEAAESHAGLFRCWPITRTRFPARPTTGGASFMNDWKARSDRGRSRKSLREAAVSAEFAGTVREITSASNPTFQRCRDLLSGPGIRKHGEAILSGTRICSEVLTRFPDQVARLDDRHARPTSADESIEWLRFSDPLFKQLDVVGTHGPLLLVKVPAIACLD